jgi:hypothetical protein
MGKKKLVQTVQANFKVDHDIVTKVRDEAKKLNLWFGEVVSVRLRHSYATHDSLPTLPGQPR